VSSVGFDLAAVFSKIRQKGVEVTALARLTL
jgi:hypothetical protein